VKNKSRTQIASEIISRVKREMQEPRLTESVRNGIRAQAARDAKEHEVTLQRV
jgi:hypothetical protein